MDDTLSSVFLNIMISASRIGCGVWLGPMMNLTTTNSPSFSSNSIRCIEATAATLGSSQSLFAAVVQEALAFHTMLASGHQKVADRSTKSSSKWELLGWTTRSL